MYTSSINFYECVIKGLVCELDILNFIDEATKNDLSKLETLQKDLEEFEINFTAQEVVESYFSEKVHHSIAMSEKFNKFKEIVLSKIEGAKTNLPQQHETITLNGSNQLHPNFNPNLWNRDCFELFKYLFDNYYSKTKRQLINIWFYLNENGID